MNKQEHLTSAIEIVHTAMKPLQRTSNLYSALRLSSVVLAIALAIYADQTKTDFGYVLALFLVAFFLVLVRKHGQIKLNLRKFQARDAVLNKLLKRIKEEWKEQCNESLDETENTVAIDLDLIGKQSLYQYLSMCATPFGKQQLQSWLLGEDDEASAIQERQVAIKELLRLEDVLLDLQTSSQMFREDQRKIKDSDFNFLLTYGKDTKKLLPSYMYQLALGLILYTLITLGLGLFKIIPLGFTAIGMLMNLCISFAMFAKAGNELAFTKNLGQIMMDYQRLFETIVKVDFHAPYLIAQQKEIKKGLIGLRKMRKVMEYLALRHNFISYLLFATLCQLDVFCLHALESWRNRYGIALESWLVSAGRMEALSSLCVIGQTKAVCCYPIILPNATQRIEITNGYHPLINEAKAIANNFMTQQGSVIITGSNMSGKTTFLRTLGVNMMLLRAGAQVCASSMSATIMEVHTSMRLRDDVNEGISTFYAELLRIRQMMDASKQKRPMLVLIDEIFKGTNSADRILCAQTAIKKLHEPWIITLVSTHDFELCELEHDKNVHAKNYHFSEYYVDDEIHFDYTLKDGRCTTTNAQQLMKMAGF